MRFLTASFIAVALAAALDAQTPPQKPQQPPQPVPTFKAGVSFVSVDVYPSANGQIVRDLKQDEFEILEDNVPQRVETFELIVARAGGIEPERSDPRTQDESNEAAADPRNRLFVLFFDTLHTAGYSAPSGRAQMTSYDPRTSGLALVKFLNEVIGPDDLVALMRPEMPVDTLTFTRRPASFSDFLSSGGEWQKRFLQGEADETERKYQTCYAGDPQAADIAPNMIARRRELLMVDGLRSLVTHLQNLREGRKAVLVVSQGWTLFTPDNRLARPLRGQVPSGPPIGIQGGQPVLGDPNSSMAGMMMRECERDRLMLAQINDEQSFRRMLDDANRANVTFYPLDPQGLSATGQSLLDRRSEAMRTLASATDGIPVIGSNDFTPGLRRIRDDLSAYYLLGYTSTNAKFDGKFRAITVRVKRPGVTVRARRGYLGPTEAEAAARAKAAAPVDPATASRDRALSALGTERRDRPFRLAAGYAFDSPAGAATRPALWIAGELDPAAARSMEWSGGADATIAVTAEDGRAIANETAAITTALPRFVTYIANLHVAPGSYLVKVRLKGKTGATGEASAQVRVSVPASSASAIAGDPMLFRRGPFSGAGFQPTADTRFRKAERIRVDVPVASPVETPTAQLLDRKGQAMPLPVTVGQREDAGRRFVTAEVTLAPLAQGDYFVEVSVRSGEKTEKVLTAFRIVP